MRKFDRTPNACAVLIQDVRWLGTTREGKEIEGVEIIVPQVFEQGSMKLVGSRLGRGYDDSATSPPVFGTGIIGQDLKLLKALHRRPHDEGMGNHLRVVDAVEQHLVRIVGSAIGLQGGT